MNEVMSLHNQITQANYRRCQLGLCSAIQGIIMETREEIIQQKKSVSIGKESAFDAGDLSSSPVSGRPPGEGSGNPLQYFCLRIPWTEEPGKLQYMRSQRVRHG